jgi:exonuclease III
VRVVTWNCHKASAQSRVWDYLLDLAPDFALLQEVCGIPNYVERRYATVQQYPVRKNGAPHQFTTAILVRGSVGNRIPLRGPAPWVDAELERFAGNLIGVELQLDRRPRLKIICVYSPPWPVDKRRIAGEDVTAVRLTQNRDVWVSDLLWAALSIHKPQPDDPWVIGGDFNLCETFDTWRGGPRGNREYLERMENFGLVDCLRYAKGAPTPTFRTQRTAIRVSPTFCSTRAAISGSLIAVESAWLIPIRTSHWRLGASALISGGSGSPCSSNNTAYQVLMNESWRFIGCSMSSFERGCLRRGFTRGGSGSNQPPSAASRASGGLAVVNFIRRMYFQESKIDDGKKLTRRPCYYWLQRIRGSGRLFPQTCQRA